MKVLHILVGFYMMFAGSLFSSDIPENDSDFNVTVEASYSFSSSYTDGSLFSYGNYVYLANSSSFEIVNVMNPSAPIMESKYSFPNNAAAHSIVAKDNYVYIARNDKLIIFNVSDKKSPTVAGEYSGKLWYLGIYGRYLTASYSSGIHIIDIFDKKNPKLVSSVLQGIDVGESVILGNYLYVVSTNYRNDALIIFDISDINNPVEVSRCTAYIGDGHGLYIKGNYAYVGDDNRFTIFDISNKANITHLSTKNYGHVSKINVQGNYAFFMDAIRSTRGFYVANVIDKENPYIVKSVTSLGMIKGMSVNHNYAYVLNTTSALAIIKLWDLQPLAIRKIEIKDNTDLRSLAQDTNMLNNLLVSHDIIDIYLKNGAWTGDIKFPTINIKEGRVINVHRASSWGSNMHLSSSEAIYIPKGDFSFKYKNGKWIPNLIVDNTKLGSLSSINNTLLPEILDAHDKVYVYLKNGAWTKDVKINIPNACSVNRISKSIIINRVSDLGSTIHIGSTTASISKGTTTYAFEL